MHKTRSHDKASSHTGIVMFGGNDGQNCKSVAVYSLLDGKTKTIFTLRNACWNASVTNENKVFTVINHEKKEVVSLSDDTYFSYVKKISFTNDSGTAHAINDSIIVAGGVTSNGDTINSKVQLVYTERITTLARMKTPRFDHCSVLHDDMLYLIGGFDGKHRLYSCEMLDTRIKPYSKSNQTVEIASLMEARSSAACVMVPNHGIVVTGGFDEQGDALSSVEIYLPSDNAWFNLPPMIRPRTGHSACLCNGKVYVVGGFFEKSVECFDFNTEVWEIHGELPTDRWAARVFPW